MSREYPSIPKTIRGTGRTTELLSHTPDGGIFIVHNLSFVRYCQLLLQKGGRKIDAVRVMTVPQATDYLKHGGFSVPPAVVTDHFVHESRPHGYGEMLSAIAFAVRL